MNELEQQHQQGEQKVPTEEPSKSELTFTIEQTPIVQNPQFNVKEEKTEMSENLKKFILDKKLELSPNFLISYCDIYDEEKRKELKKLYNINCLNMENYFIISQAEKNYIFYNKLIEAIIEIKYEDSTKDNLYKFTFCSSYDFAKECQDKHYYLI